MKPALVCPAVGAGGVGSADRALRRWWRELGPLVQFGIVYECRSVSRAAEHLALAKSTVSEAVARLEVLRKARLLEDKTGLPTAAGEALYRHCARPILEAVRAARLDEVGVGPLLSLGASEYIIQEYLVPILAAFRLQVPNLRVQLRSGHRRELEDALLAGSVDLAILAVDKPNPSFVAQELLRVPIALFVPAACRAKSAAEFLAQQPPYALVCPPSVEGVSGIFCDYRDRLGLRWPVTIDANRTALIPVAVAAGDAAGPCVQIGGFVEQAGVRALPLPGLPLLRVMAFSRGEPSALLRTLLENISDIARSMGGG